MSSIKVVDLNEARKELPAIEEEPKEEVIETPVINEVVEETNEEIKEEQSEIINEVVEEVGKASLNSNPVGVEVNEEVEEEIPKPKAKPKPKPSDLVFCPDCSSQMTYKNLRYSHKCSPEPPPVKPHTKPKAKTKPKATPKPPPDVYYSDTEEEQTTYKPLSKPVKNQILKPQPINPTTALAQHYQLLQQAFIKQKQEKYNNLCMNMFSSKTKKIDLIIRL